MNNILFWSLSHYNIVDHCSSFLAAQLGTISHVHKRGRNTFIGIVLRDSHVDN